MKTIVFQTGGPFHPVEARPTDRVLSCLPTKFKLWKAGLDWSRSNDGTTEFSRLRSLILCD
jgi:hypothetical protein